MTREESDCHLQASTPPCFDGISLRKRPGRGWRPRTGGVSGNPATYSPDRALCSHHTYENRRKRGREEQGKGGGGGGHVRARTGHLVSQKDFRAQRTENESGSKEEEKDTKWLNSNLVERELCVCRERVGEEREGEPFPFRWFGVSSPICTVYFGTAPMCDTQRGGVPGHIRSAACAHSGPSPYQASLLPSLLGSKCALLTQKALQTSNVSKE